jgi:serine/threonine protein phosphatase PrpC
LDEPWLLRASDFEAPSSVGFAGGEAVVYTHRSPFRQTDNQDSAAVIPATGNYGALVVADGAGGHAGGDQASGLAVQHIARSMQAAREAERDPRDGILDGFEAANRAICSQTAGAVTTLVVAELVDGAVRIYHAGDSMALLVGQRGRVKHSTVAHSPVGYAVEAGILDEVDAMKHDDRHVISNALGVDSMHIEVGPMVKLAVRDTLLLASDGLFDNIATQEIIDLMRKGPLLKAVNTLVERSRARMLAVGTDDGPSKPDDLTILAWRPMAPSKPRSASRESTPGD